MKFRSILFSLIVCGSLAVLGMQSGGCSSLNKFDPADKGNPAAQIAQAVSQASTQPVVQGGAAIATAATGFPVSTMLYMAGGLATILAGLFGAKKLGAAQAHLDVAQEAAGVTTNAAAIANLVSNNNPTVQKIESDVNLAAGAVAQVAPLVGQLAPAAASVANEVAQGAAAVQQATAQAPAAPQVTINKVGNIT